MTQRGAKHRGGFDVRVTGDHGKSVMIVVLSDEPLTSVGLPDAPKTVASPIEALSVIDRLRKELLTRNLMPIASNGSREQAKPNWPVDMREYTVE